MVGYGQIQLAAKPSTHHECVVRVMVRMTMMLN